MKNEYIVIYVTAKDKRQATTIATALLKDRLIACANVVPQITSIYTWKGKIEQSKEVLLILKTKKTSFHAVAKKVKSMHSYEVPEIIALPIVAGEKFYLSWLKESVC